MLVAKLITLRFAFLYICFIAVFLLYNLNYSLVDRLSLTEIQPFLSSFYFFLYGLGGAVGIGGIIKKHLLCQFVSNNILITVLFAHLISIIFYSLSFFTAFLILFTILSLLYRNSEIKLSQQLDDELETMKKKKRGK